MRCPKTFLLRMRSTAACAWKSSTRLQPAGSDASYIIELAEYVDGKMRAVSEQTATVDSVRLAVLAALNIADEYHLLKRRQDAPSPKRGSAPANWQPRWMRFWTILAARLSQAFSHPVQSSVTCGSSSSHFCATSSSNLLPTILHFPLAKLSAVS